ncbi:RNA-directed DNA polymerase [Vibrio natriegens]|uniref:RNA-directed DNA polymerase n=1 Tax=Vibrio natriegens TaxID=691 RepID=UPI001EFE382D|nr:RNA-directed DNA polymerase [Vibrio natriegens]MCG9703300.1 RNA-directed DNA polymerase [Vibrio natriegens]
MLIHRVIDHLDEALTYISKRSLHKGDNDDIWDLRFQWLQRKAELSAQLLSQTYVFSPCRVFEYKPGKFLHTFRSVDKLVLKALALTLIDVLPRSPLCFSYAGHGGVPGALRYMASYASCRFGFKTDVADYYASIDHVYLSHKLAPYLDTSISVLMYRALKVHDTGLPRGSALSHVLGNFYLHELDALFERRQSTQHYCRYMDDVLVLTECRGALRRASQAIAQHLSHLGLQVARGKQWIGQTPSRACQLNFLGAPFTSLAAPSRSVSLVYDVD